ncbi:MAG: secretin N-terminal domain-containing protein [Planctomycetota bacterium]|jgi:type II secretory pathway component GspD/PulD (secretin)
MNRIIYTGRDFCFIAMCCAVLASLPVYAGQNQPMPVGRENPFAEITRPGTLGAQAGILNSPDFAETTPELSIETVKLKSLDAKTLSSAIEGMCSPYGSVSADTKSNSLVICDTSENLARILAEIRKADGTAPEPLLVETANLKFLDAESLTEGLKGMLSPYGSVTVNKSSNSLIISDTEEYLSRILTEIERADKTPRQIMVEVVILDVKLSDDTEIGVNWDFLSTSNRQVQYRQSFPPTRLGTTAPDESTILNNTAYNTTGLGGNFSVITGTIRNVVGLLQEKRDVEILASPRAMMVSGQNAKIRAVEEIPYSEVSDTAAGGAGALTSTQFKEVGVTLEVTATITDGNNIFLTLDSEQSVRTSDSPTGVPVVDAREVDTSLMLKDGQIVVIGGLRRQEKTNQVSQIPILGDIPLLGLLFKYTNTVVTNTELIVFVSPHIYREGEPIPEDAMSKYKEITEKPMLSPSVPENKEATKDQNREASKERLLKRIEELQDRKDEDAAEELLSNLSDLEEILSQEMKETLDSSQEVLAQKGEGGSGKMYSDSIRLYRQ